MASKKDNRLLLPAFPRVYLYTYRVENKISVETIASKLGISATYYFYLENGNRGDKMTVLLLSKLIHLFDLDAQTLIDDEIKYQENKNKYLEDYKKRTSMSANTTSS